MSLKTELYAEATRLGIKGRSKMTTDELMAACQDAPGNRVVVNRHGDVSVSPEPLPTTPDEFPSVESAHRMLHDLSIVVDNRSRHAARMAKTKTSAVNKRTPNRMTRMVRASQSCQYGRNDRGLGAKHFASGLHPVTGHTLPYGRVSNPDAIKPLAYGDRVRHYAKQNGQPTASVEGFPGPLLTNRQWRRLDKKDNRNKFLHRPTKEARYA